MERQSGAYGQGTASSAQWRGSNFVEGEEEALYEAASLFAFNRNRMLSKVYAPLVN